MAFIVTLIALLIERFFDCSHLRNWYWYTAFQRAVTKRFASMSPYIILALTIIPVLVIVLLIQMPLKSWVYGFPNLIFELLVLIYCLGPKNLWADSFACINAMMQGDAQYAAEKLKTSFDIVDTKYSQSLHKHLLNSIFIEANRRVFAVIFWYVILGLWGAVLYKMITISAPEADKEDVVPELTQSARFLESILNWLPVRLFTFIFALGGHFVQVLSCWRKKALLGLGSNEILLTECGTAALGDYDDGKIPEDGSAEKSAISLLDRSFTIALVLIAIVVLMN